MLNDRLRIHAGDRVDTAPAATERPRTTHTPRPIEIVFFDFCGVLYDDSYWRRWLLQLISRMGLHTHYALFFRAWECEFQDEVCRGHLEIWHALKMFLQAAGLSSAQIEEVTAAGVARFRAFEEQIRPFPNVVATLAQLAARDVQLVLTSAYPLDDEALDAKLQRLQLTKWFPKETTRGDWVDATTRTDSFREQLDKHGTAPEHAAYVGRRREDLCAAAATGLLTVAFNQDADAVADVYIEQFDQLCDVVKCQPSSMLAAG